jgi:hypothetical protein
MKWLRELEEWRSGKRRVFWRVRYTVTVCGCTVRYSFDSVSRREARNKCHTLRGLSTKLYRVTVRPR